MLTAIGKPVGRTMCDEFMSLTELGKLYGVSSHKMGQWLVDIGLRDKNKKPSQSAFEGGYVQRRASTQPGTYFWVWHAAKTTQTLEKAGHQQAANNLESSG
jgi:hypothetical protein